MPAPVKPRAKRSIPVSELCKAIERARENTQDSRNSLAFLAGWLGVNYPQIGAALEVLTKANRDGDFGR